EKTTPTITTNSKEDRMSAGVMIDASILYLTVEVTRGGTPLSRLNGYELFLFLSSSSCSSSSLTFL
ncbi:hypothetical protein OAK76_01935, partial [Akkermansiaceae bacterium]|nr:hypothetical protein [Akkermansiaceae bacterium]